MLARCLRLRKKFFSSVLFCTAGLPRPFFEFAYVRAQFTAPSRRILPFLCVVQPFLAVLFIALTQIAFARPTRHFERSKPTSCASQAYHDQSGGLIPILFLTEHPLRSSQ